MHNKNPVRLEGSYPTVKVDGIAPDLELSFRHLAVHLIQYMGLLLSMLYYRSGRWKSKAVVKARVEPATITR